MPAPSLDNCPVFVVGLEKSPERWRPTLASLRAAGFEPELFRGVDGREPIEFRAGEALAPLGGCFNWGLVGVYLSYYRLFKMALARGWERIVVFEDDVRPLPGLRDTIEETLALDASFEHVKLHRMPLAVERVFDPARHVAHRLRAGATLWRSPWHIAGLQGFVAHRAGLQKIMRRAQPMRMEIDVWLSRFPRHGLRLYEFVGEPVLKSGVNPSIIGAARSLPRPRARKIFHLATRRIPDALRRAAYVRLHQREFFHERAGRPKALC